MWPARLANSHSWGCRPSTPLGLPTTGSCNIADQLRPVERFLFLISKSHIARQGITLAILFVFAFWEGLLPRGPDTVLSVLARPQVLTPRSSPSGPQALLYTLWLTGLWCPRGASYVWNLSEACMSVPCAHLNIPVPHLIYDCIYTADSS